MKFIEDSQLPSFHILIISLMKIVMYKVGSHFLGVSFILYIQWYPKITDPGGHQFPGLQEDNSECWTLTALFQSVLRISWNSFRYPFIAALTPTWWEQWFLSNNSYHLSSIYYVTGAVIMFSFSLQQLWEVDSISVL